MNVEHYLGVYRLRKRMIDEGISNPTPKERDLINNIVDKLSKMNPMKEIQVTNKGEDLILSEINGNHLITDMA